MLHLQYHSKVSWQSITSLNSRFSIPSVIENQEQAIKNQVEDRMSQNREQKIHPWLIFYKDIQFQHNTAWLFEQATVGSKKDQFKL